jgi:hypothetical protein
MGDQQLENAEVWKVYFSRKSGVFELKTEGCQQHCQVGGGVGNLPANRQEMQVFVDPQKREA